MEIPTLREWMTPDPIAVEPHTPVREALEVLEAAHIRHLPVVEDGRLVGFVSDRTLRPWRQALLDVRNGEGSDLAELVLQRPIRAFMIEDVLFLHPDRPVTDAIDLLLDFRIGAVPLVDDGQLVGIVSRMDLLELLQELLLSRSDD